MKTALKVTAITLIVAVLLLISVASYAIWFIFTPEKLTPLIKNQADKLLTCQANIGEVELTFFSTFPEFGLKINDFALVNTDNPALPDTIINTDELVCVLNIRSLIKGNTLSINQLIARNGNINIYTDSLGVANYNILKESGEKETTVEEDSVSFNLIDISGVNIDNINLSYIDKKLNVDAKIEGLTADIDGSLKSDILKSRMRIKQSKISATYNDTTYLLQADIKLNLDSKYDLANQKIDVERGTLTVNGLALELSGSANYDSINASSTVNLKYGIKDWQITDILALIPEAYKNYVADVKASGLISSRGIITGSYDSINIPVLDIMLELKDGNLQYPAIGMPISNINAIVTATIDKQNVEKSIITIDSSDAATPKSKFAVKGDITNIWGDMEFKLTANSDMVFEEFNRFIPHDLKTNAKGRANGELKGVFTMSQIDKMDLDNMNISGKFNLKDAVINYDSITVATNRSAINFTLPNEPGRKKGTSFIYAHLDADDFSASKIDGFKLNLKGASIAAETSDVRDTTGLPQLSSTFKIKNLHAEMDTNLLKINNPEGKIEILKLGKDNKRPKIVLEYKSDEIAATNGENKLNLDHIDLNTTAVNSINSQEIIKQWIAKGDFKLDNADITIAGVNQSIKIPKIDVDFSPTKFNINSSEVTIGKSDFQLVGELKNIVQYLKGDSLLRGNFKFTSSNTDITQLMKLTSGMGANEDTLKITDNGMPYMVPQGIDIELNTNINMATFNGDTATAINGALKISDGVLVLDNMNFSTPAARMQLTALYKTPRKNHLFASFDYHMIDVEIEELLKMIPDIDSLMPMLRSFGGKGEFHIAAETYLDSSYNIKKSTLRGVSSISGQDLVLMDGETFSEIAKTLKFSKKTMNRVDSLSAEFTIFKQEIDVYPFMIVMDKYKAVVSGQHNFDMNFKYHISVVDCPLPIKLGVDVTGNMDDMKYRLAKCKYKEFYRPASRKLVENKQLEIRKMIRDALLKRVAETPSN